MNGSGDRCLQCGVEGFHHVVGQKRRAVDADGRGALDRSADRGLPAPESKNGAVRLLSANGEELSDV